MKLSRLQFNIIFVSITVLATGVITGILWHNLEQHRKQVEICKIRRVDQYLDERYGDKRPGLDMQVVTEVNKEALEDCQNAI